MTLSADLLSPATITIAAAMAGTAALIVRALKSRPAPTVLVVDRNGRVHELPADDPRVTSRM